MRQCKAPHAEPARDRQAHAPEAQKVSVIQKIQCIAFGHQLDFHAQAEGKVFDQLAAARAESAAARAEAEAWKQRAFAAEAQLETNNSEVRRHQECIATLRAARWSSLPIAAAAAAEAATEATATHISEHARQHCELSILAGELFHTEQSLQDASLAAMHLGVKAEEYLQMLFQHLAY